MLLEIRSLTKRFSGLTALDKVDMEVAEGEILGLIGPNGSGKSTLVNCVTGFYRPEKGFIEFNGEKVSDLATYQICRKGISRTFQIPKPFKNISVLENVMDGAITRSSVKEAREVAVEMLQLLGLLSRRDALAKELTGPDKKRMELARALCTKPKLLMLDEIMSGLNPKECDEFIALVRKINNDGITIVFIEHIMRVVMNISNRIVVLSSGQKIAEGTPEEVSKNSEVIKAYLGSDFSFAQSQEH